MGEVNEALDIEEFSRYYGAIHTCAMLIEMSCQDLKLTSAKQKLETNIDSDLRAKAFRIFKQLGNEEAVDDMMENAIPRHPMMTVTEKHKSLHPLRPNSEASLVLQSHIFRRQQPG